MTLLLDSASPVPWDRADGYAGGIRYVSLEPAKNLRPPERDLALAAGKDLALVEEDGPTDFRGGANVGAAKAHAIAPLLEELRWPAGRPVYAADDAGGIGMDPSLYQVTYEGMAAFAASLGRPVAVYGIRAFLEWCARMHQVRYLWECASASTNTGPEPAAYVQQQARQVSIGGVTCDVDEVVGDLPDWGQVPAPRATPWLCAPSVLVLQRDDRGPQVKALQGALKALGFYEELWVCNGAYGTLTEQAVARFQAAHNITETPPGVRFGPECWAALFGEGR